MWHKNYIWATKKSAPLSSWSTKSPRISSENMDAPTCSAHCCEGSVSLAITARHRISWCIPISHNATKPPCSWTGQYAPSIIHDVHLKCIYSPRRRSFIFIKASRLSINTPLLSFCESIFLQNVRLVLFLLWRCDPTRVMASSNLMFLDHTRRTTVGRTPLDEWSARRRDLYLTAHNTHNRQISMPRWDSNPRSQLASGRRPTP